MKKEFIVKDSGQRANFETGAVRDIQTNKPRYDLISPLALKRVAQLMARGAEKYDERNWEKGIPMSRCYASMLRHAFQYGTGDTDEDHLAAVCFNAMAIMHFEENQRFDLMDMPFELHDKAKALLESIEQHNDTKQVRKTKNKTK